MVSGRASPKTWAAVLAAMAVAGGSPAANNPAWNQLLDRPPFSVAGDARPAAPAARFEFRGYCTMGDETLFYVFMPERKTGAWLPLGQLAGDILLTEHDTENEILTLECRGRTHRLPLRRALIVNIGAPADMPPPDVDLVPPRYIRNGLRNQSLTREEVAPHMDNDWFRDFVRKYGPPVYRTEP